MDQRTRHILRWGVLRYALGIAQMALSVASFIFLLTGGLRPITFVFAGAATVLAVVSRILYRGQRRPLITFVFAKHTRRH